MKDQRLKNQVKPLEIEMTSGFVEEINGFESITGFEPRSSFLKQNLVDHKLIDLRVDVRRGLDLEAVTSSTCARRSGASRMTTRRCSTPRMSGTPSLFELSGSTLPLWALIN